jgi:hypothetical protein
MKFSLKCSNCDSLYSVEAKSYELAKESCCSSCGTPYKQKEETSTMVCECGKEFEYKYSGMCYLGDVECPCGKVGVSVHKDIDGNSPALVRESVEKLSSPEWFKERVNKMNKDLYTNAKVYR